MNTSKLKTYAPAARAAFIEAVTRRAGVFGIRDGVVEAVSETGDVAMIGGQAFPRSIVPLRKKLMERIGKDGFSAVMEAAAYTWFNRLVAIRFMEIHGYFDHGFRVLSDPQGGQVPEILQKAEQVTMTELDRNEVVRLKLAGNRDEELYRLLLTAQCQELNRIMPDVFGKLDDETLLLLPDNLLHSDSLVRQLVAASEEADWQEVEVLGWLYQFYISDKEVQAREDIKREKRAYRSDEIPAVTQLFTPHWIVRYLVENSLGRLWLLNRPHSKLRDHMPYYIEGEPEADFLRIGKPEDIRLCDPAVGSGHMLTYAFDLLYLIYEEEGYPPGDIPGLILTHNLTGLEICPRAAQLAEIALVFKARENARRFFQPGQFVRPNIICLQNVRFEENELRDYIHALGLGDLFNQPMLKLLHQFEEATNFGSLIQPCLDERAIAFARHAIEVKELGDQLFLRETHRKVLRVLEQAEALTQRYHVVVANPPYMGSRDHNASIAAFSAVHYSKTSADLFSMFLERGFTLVTHNGIIAMVTMESWMFLPAYSDFRRDLLRNRTIHSLVHMPYLGRGGTPMGISFGTAATVFFPFYAANHEAQFSYTRFYELSENGLPKTFPTQNERLQKHPQSRFLSIPSSPIAYWISDKLVSLFSESRLLGKCCAAKQGIATGSNETFLRRWSEVSRKSTCFTAGSVEDAASEKVRWFPYSKGGEARKWYGNLELLVDWEADGKRIRNFKDQNGKLRSRPQNLSYQFREAATWSLTSSKQDAFGGRWRPAGCMFDINGMSAFPSEDLSAEEIVALLSSKVSVSILNFINPTFAFQSGDIGRIPIPAKLPHEVYRISRQLITIARADWDNFETSWDFRDQPLLRPGLKGATLEGSWRNWEAQSTDAIRRMQELETENNRLFIAAYGLEGELQPEVPEEQITLARADRYTDCAALVSYVVGCMMGRYSLDQPGLILADAGGTVEDYLAKVPNPSFQPDADGIIPLTEHPWFDDDAANRLEEFLRVAFGRETLEENLQFLATSLGAKATEPAREALRRYLANEFFKNHLSGERAYGYKNRPIYWLFSSGKQQAFQCLVYLHRYTPGTLARMRTEYVIPLQGKIAARIAHLEDEKTHATASAQRKKLQTEQDKLVKQQTELRAFDEQLRHYADQRIALDLDDGVKVNYAKFGPLVAEAKKVCGKKEEE